VGLDEVGGLPPIRDETADGCGTRHDLRSAAAGPSAPLGAKDAPNYAQDDSFGGYELWTHYASCGDPVPSIRDETADGWGTQSW
jgi:hypothetical protein